MPSSFFWQVGVQLDWNFDGFGNAFRAAQSDATMMQKVYEKKDLHAHVRKEVDTTYDELQRLLKRLHVAQIRFESAQHDFGRAQKQHDVGLLADVEFDEAHYTWSEEDDRYRKSNIEVVQQYRQLLLVCGYPDDGGLLDNVVC